MSMVMGDVYHDTHSTGDEESQ